MESLKLEQSRTRRALLVAAIMAVALGLRLYYFVGVSLNDDMAYVGAARQIATGLGIHFYPLLSNVTLRFLMILPIAGAYRVFWESEFIACAYPLACSIVTVLLTYLLARRLFGWQVGIGAALLMAFFPMNIVYSTQLIPQVPLACAVTASLLCLLEADRLCLESDAHPRRRGAFLMAASGVLLGIGWMINEPAPFFLAIIVLYPLLRKKVTRWHLAFVAGAFGVLLVECLVFKLATGDSLWRLKTIRNTVNTIGTNIEFDYYPRAFFNLININFTWHEGHFGLFCYLFVLATVFLLATRQKEVFFLLFGSWIILLYFQFGVMTSSGRPIGRWIRYIEMLLPCATIIVSLALVRFGEMGTARWKGWGLLGAFLLSNFWFIPRAAEANRAYTRPLRNAAEFLRELPPDKPIYSDKGATDLLSVYLGDRQYRRIEGEHLDAIHNAYAVVNGTEYVVRKKITPFAHPENNRPPPPGWELIKRIEPPWDTIHGPFRPLVYRVPAKPLATQGEEWPDSEGDVEQVLASVELETSLLDILGASAAVTEDLLVLNLELKRAREDALFRDVQLIYLWVLDLDRDVTTGTKYGTVGTVGADLNIRISNERGFWWLLVDDANESDLYSFEDAPVWFRFGESGVRARLPVKAFSELGEFRWRAVAIARTLGKREQTIAYDLLGEE